MIKLICISERNRIRKSLEDKLSKKNLSIEIVKNILKESYERNNNTEI